MIKTNKRNLPETVSVENNPKHQTLNHFIIFKFCFHRYYITEKNISRNILMKVLFKETFD